MLKYAKGHRLFRKIVVRIIFPEKIFPPKVITQRAGPRQGFGPNNVDTVLDGIAEQLEQLYPYWDFKLIELAPEGRTAKFVMDFAGYRAGTTAPETTAAINEYVEDNPQKESSALETEAAGLQPVSASGSGELMSG